MASTYLTRTLGTATNRKKFTISFWMKRSGLGQQYVWQSFYSSNFGYRLGIYFDSTDELVIKGVDGGSTHTLLKTNRKLRDTNGWYHCYFAFDSTQGTASDRVKIYINGVQETSFSTGTYPNQNTDFAVGVDGSINYLLQSGKYGGGSSNYFDGSMSHFYYVDGSVIAHTQFGSTDATTGEWKINTSPTISSYGTAGFLILKDGNTITDQSSNSNDFTLGAGTLTKTEDNPSNVFATGNPLNQPHSDYVLTQGNNTITLGGGTEKKAGSATIGVASGKFYWEVKLLSQSAETYCTIGISGASDLETGIAGSQSTDYFYRGTDAQLKYNNTAISYGATWGVGDIIGVALDCTSAQNTLTFYKNGVSQGAINIISASSTPNGVYLPSCAKQASATPVFNFNFGNGYFGTTAVSSAGTNASGIGIFEYDVPTGFTALSTKGLNL
jgi:hypothetical protein